MRKYSLVFAVASLAALACFVSAPLATGQIQSTISCPSGYGYWDVLSIMMMDPSLAPSDHMEGYDSNGDPSRLRSERT